MTKPQHKQQQPDKDKEKPAKKKLHLIYGHRRRKHNSDSDTNEDDEEPSQSEYDSVNNSAHSEDLNEDDEEGTVVQSSSGGSSSGRRRVVKQRFRTKRKKNIAKFVDRENLSETELNHDLSDNESDDDELANRNRRSTQKTGSDSKLNEDEKAATNSTHSLTMHEEDLTKVSSLESNITSSSLTPSESNPAEILVGNQQTDTDLVQTRYIIMCGLYIWDVTGVTLNY